MRMKEIANIITEHTGVPLKAMRREGKQPEHVTHSRNLLIYALATVLQMPFTEIAKVVQRDQSSCRRAFDRVERQREQPIYNRFVVEVVAKCRNAHRKATTKAIS